MNDGWWDIEVDDLSNEELADKDRIGSRAWYVLFGKRYLSIFENELEYRSIQ